MKTFIKTLVITAAMAQTEEQKTTYQAFNDAIAIWDQPSWEPYEVTASDGAITTLFHLKGNAATFKEQANGQSILLNHGSFMDATSWFKPEGYGITFEEGDKPLPIALLDMGYDVWLANMRGTQYSRKHTTLDSNDPNSEYWKFSWAEKGMLDMPAAI